MGLMLDLNPYPSVRMALTAPLYRLWVAPWYAKAIGVVAAASDWLLGMPFLQLVLLYVGICFFDYLLGSAVARRDGDYDPLRARAGAIGKASNVLLILILRTLEAVLHNLGVHDTHGAIAVGICLILIVVELESYDGHKEALTGRPTPFLRPALEFFRHVAQGGLWGAAVSGGKE